MPNFLKCLRKAGKSCVLDPVRERLEQSIATATITLGRCEIEFASLSGYTESGSGESRVV